jgi:hypothetical protein
VGRDRLLRWLGMAGIGYVTVPLVAAAVAATFPAPGDEWHWFTMAARLPTGLLLLAALTGLGMRHGDDLGPVSWTAMGLAASGAIAMAAEGILALIAGGMQGAAAADLRTAGHSLGMLAVLAVAGLAVLGAATLASATVPRWPAQIMVGALAVAALAALTLGSLGHGPDAAVTLAVAAVHAQVAGWGYAIHREAVGQGAERRRSPGLPSPIVDPG